MAAELGANITGSMVCRGWVRSAKAAGQACAKNYTIHREISASRELDSEAACSARRARFFTVEGLTRYVPARGVPGVNQRMRFFGAGAVDDGEARMVSLQVFQYGAIIWRSYFRRRVRGIR